MLDLIVSFIELLWWPYELWKKTTASSRVGISPDEEKTIRFWYRFALIATVGILASILLLALASIALNRN